MSEKNHRGTKPSLPRRARQIHRFAHDLASHRLSVLSLRQAASDKIGYAVATVIGAAAFHYAGEGAVLILVEVYLFNALRAYRKYLIKAKTV